MTNTVEKTTPVKIVKSEVIRLLKEGKTRQELADHFGLPLLQMKVAMKKMNLTHNKAHKVSFEIIDDVPATTEIVKEKKVVSESPVVTPTEEPVTKF